MSHFKSRKKNQENRAKNRFNSAQRTTLTLIVIGASLSLLVAYIPKEQRDQFLIIAGGICTGAIGYLSNRNETRNYQSNEQDKQPDERPDA